MEHAPSTNGLFDGLATVPEEEQKGKAIIED